jgi:hypothetical protein
MTMNRRNRRNPAKALRECEEGVERVRQVLDRGWADDPDLAAMELAKLTAGLIELSQALREPTALRSVAGSGDNDEGAPTM